MSGDERDSGLPADYVQLATATAATRVASGYGLMPSEACQDQCRFAASIAESLSLCTIAHTATTERSFAYRGRGATRWWTLCSPNTCGGRSATVLVRRMVPESQRPLVGGSRINQAEAPDQLSMGSRSDSVPGRTFPRPLHGTRRPRFRVYHSMGASPSPLPYRRVARVRSSWWSQNRNAHRCTPLPRHLAGLIGARRLPCRTNWLRPAGSGSSTD